MQSRQLILVFAIVLAALAGFGWYRHTALQREAMFKSGAALKGITMVHFWATW